LNGVAVVPAKVTITFVSSGNAGVTLSGVSVIVASGTPSGTYKLIYKICEVVNPTNCDQDTVTVTVNSPAINAVADAGSANGFSGGIAISNVLGNDLLNGAPVVPA